MRASEWVRPGVHFLFWLLAFFFYVFFFGRRDAAYRETVVFASVLLPITIGTTYFLTAFLIPRYLLLRRYGRFVLYTAYTLILSANLELVATLWLQIVSAISGGRPLRPVAFDVWGLIIAQYVVVFAAVSGSLVTRWYRMQQANANLERARLEAELKLKETELKLLKAQIHPHFLFNTLNSLYALTLERSPSAPDMVLKLSEMLDYILHRSDRRRVPLQEEVEHLRNYLVLERLRYGDRASVSMKVTGVSKKHAIAPLLLLPLVENAVKHGVARAPGQASVDIFLTVAGDEMVFEVSNSIPSQKQVPDASGIGLANLRRRLELQYPRRHTLEVAEIGPLFRVTLRIRLQDGGAS